MKVLLSWLREFAPGIDGDPADLADALSALGLAVEAMTVTGEVPAGVVAARVLSLRPHPDADRIQLVDVDDGRGDAVQVCCGAFNMAVGDLVPLARVGAVLGGGLEIRRRTIRGQDSFGMCCSGAELGLSDDADGILILDDLLPDDGPGGAGRPEPGTPLAEALGLGPDVLWDLEVNANRPDAMSVMGVARDLAAAVGVDFAAPEWTPPPSGEPASGAISVEIVDPTLCGRFHARLLRGVTGAESPAWMRRRLTALGMRPVNGIVDVSNYVMLELGQPSHAFDLAKLPGGHLRVRRAADGERIVTLDGVERTLADGDGVIADGDDEPIGIAGIMGGRSTEISPDTADVLMEMAWWDPPSVSRTAKRLNLSSEAATRFRRGADWGDNVERAAARFCQLAAEMGMTVASGAVDERGDLPDRSPLRVRTARINGMLGTDLDAAAIGGHLRSIGFEATPAGDGGEDLDVTVPTWRWDTSTETDMAEEVARLHGFDNIERTVPRSSDAGSLSGYQQDRRLVRQVLVGAGCDETQPMPFLAPDDLAAAGLPSDGIVLTNPLDAGASVLRTSLLPGQLQAVSYNQRHFNPAVRFFEIGHVYLPPPEGQLLPDEPEMAAVALAGEEAPEAAAVLSALSEALALPGLEIRAEARPGLHPTRSAEVIVAGRSVGEVGEVDPAVLERFGITGPVGWLQLDLTAVLGGPHGNRTYKPVSKYPPSDVDLAFVVPDGVAAAAVERSLRSAGGALLAEVDLFDAYRGPGLPASARSLAYHLRFCAPDRTLTDAEVSRLRQSCVDRVTQKTGATLRT